MDKSNSLTNSILQSTESTIPSSSIDSDISSTSGDNTGVFGFFKSINLTTWVLIK